MYCIAVTSSRVLQTPVSHEAVEELVDLLYLLVPHRKQVLTHLGYFHFLHARSQTLSSSRSPPSHIGSATLLSVAHSRYPGLGSSPCSKAGNPSTSKSPPSAPR